MHHGNNPSDTTRILDKHTIYVHTCTLFVCLSNILVVSGGLFLLCMNYSCCIWRIVFVMHKLFLLYLMEYIRESRRPPGRLKGGSGGVGGAGPPQEKVKKYFQPKLSWGKCCEHIAPSSGAAPPFWTPKSSAITKAASELLEIARRHS